MQSNFAMPLTSCDQFKTLAIIDVINKMEKLTQIKNTILSNISDKVTQRIGRLQNIKRSPILAVLGETFYGMDSIRAFNKLKAVAQSFQLISFF